MVHWRYAAVLAASCCDVVKLVKLGSPLSWEGSARQGLKGTSEDDVEAVLDRVMMLFRYLQEKDVFEKYYKQHLAKRLLSGRTARPPPSQGSFCLLPAQLCQQAVGHLCALLGTNGKLPRAHCLYC